MEIVSGLFWPRGHPGFPEDEISDRWLVPLLAIGAGQRRSPPGPGPGQDPEGRVEQEGPGTNDQLWPGSDGFQDEAVSRRRVRAAEAVERLQVEVEGLAGMGECSGQGLMTGDDLGNVGEIDGEARLAGIVADGEDEV